MYEESYLEHYGVPGMKKGIRKVREKLGERRAAKADKKAATKERDAELKRIAKLRKTPNKKLLNDELTEKRMRLVMERDIKNAKTDPETKKLVANTITAISKDVIGKKKK